MSGVRSVAVEDDSPKRATRGRTPSSLPWRSFARAHENLPQDRGGFWHEHVPVQSLCLYRIGVGLLLSLESLYRLPHAVELYSSAGFHIGTLARFAPPPWAARGLCTLLALTSILLCVGLMTRAATLMTLGLWSFLYGIDSINEKAIHSVLIVVLTILAFSHCGARLSLDHHLRAKRGKPVGPDRVCILPLRLLQIEFAQVYLFSSLTKMLNTEWNRGIVLERSLQSHWATVFGVWVSNWVGPRVAQIAGLGAIYYELLASFLLFVPWTRRWVIAVGLAFHLGIQATLSIGSLGCHFMLALLLLYPDPEAVAAWLHRMRDMLPARAPVEGAP